MTCDLFPEDADQARVGCHGQGYVSPGGKQRPDEESASSGFPERRYTLAFRDIPPHLSRPTRESAASRIKQ